jgi:ribosomal protein S18 acetylase RimI-like enzyme
MEAFSGVSIDQNIEHRHGTIHGRDWRWRKARQVEADAQVHPQGLFVAEHEGAVVGYVTTRVDAEAGFGHIPNLAVAANVRRQGLARRLLGHALDYLRSQGLTHVRIETLEQNAIGRQLFPALGFEEMARQIHYVMALGPSPGGERSV